MNFRTLAIVGLLGCWNCFADNLSISIPRQYAQEVGIQTNNATGNGETIEYSYTGVVYPGSATIKPLTELRTLPGYSGKGFANATDALTGLFSLYRAHEHQKCLDVFPLFNKSNDPSVNNYFDGVQSVSPIALIENIDGYDSVLFFKMNTPDTEGLNLVTPLLLKKTNDVYSVIEGNITQSKAPTINYIFSRLNGDLGNSNVKNFIKSSK